MKKRTLGEKDVCYYQFRRRHDYPPHQKKNDVWSNLLQILKIGGFVV